MAPVVIPHDPFWAELWATVGDPLLLELMNPEWPVMVVPHEQPVVRSAVAAYDRILHQLPPDMRRLVVSHARQKAAVARWKEVPDSRRMDGRVFLYGADGRPLTPMHVIDVAITDLCALIDLQEHVAPDEAPHWSSIFAAVCDVNSWAVQNVSDVYRRAVGVLTRIPPDSLLAALAPARGSRDVEIVLSEEEQAAYDTHRDDIIRVVSGHDPGLTARHRKLYM